ncbi:MAG: TolC family protein [Sandaracinaceae bacterium]|nr:TolC family protein [Sandaracinaceae bacterium]
MRRVRALVTISALSAALALPMAAAADPPGAGEPAREVPVRDLDALTKQAERSYPGLRAARARIRAAQAQLDEAWVSPFFQSTITAGVSIAPEVRGSPIFSPDPQLPVDNPWQPILGFSIEGVIPLWTFGKLPAARDAARAGIRAAEGDQARVRAQLRYDVRRAYFALQLALDLRQMLDEGLPPIREAAARLEEQIANGDPEVGPMDRWRMQAALSEIEAREADVRRLEASARAALRILTGLPRVRIPECPIEPVAMELGPRARYVRSARRDRPEVRMLEAAVRARQASLDFHEAGFFPDIALAYRFGTTWAPGITDQTNPFVIDQANYTSIAAGLVFRWSLDLWGNAYRVDREGALLDDARERSQEAGARHRARGHRRLRGGARGGATGRDLGPRPARDAGVVHRGRAGARGRHGGDARPRGRGARLLHGPLQPPAGHPRPQRGRGQPRAHLRDLDRHALGAPCE